MRVLVFGGAGSGKSACAERLAVGLSTDRTYLATMSPEGAEARRRIARHVRQRDGLGFKTVECASGLPFHGEVGAPAGVALLDDVGNLVSNALFATDGTMRDEAGVLCRLECEVRSLSGRFEHLVVVGNDVGRDGIAYGATTMIWVRLVGSLCCRLAADFDSVVEVVCGVPQVVKGRLP